MIISQIKALNACTRGNLSFSYSKPQKNCRSYIDTWNKGRIHTQLGWTSSLTEEKSPAVSVQQALSASYKQSSIAKKFHHQSHLFYERDPVLNRHFKMKTFLIFLAITAVLYTATATELEEGNFPAYFIFAVLIINFQSQIEQISNSIFHI